MGSWCLGALAIIELYCTYFDHNYLRKGLALYLSLRRASKPERAVLVVLALSKRCEQILNRLCLPDLLVIPLRQLEDQEPRLLQAKSNRSTIEYFFTLTPWLISAALKQFPDASRATYLDSDLYFFNSPKPLWDEISSSAMAFVEHRFSAGYADKIIFGKFNVSWNSFDRNNIAQEALQWWAEKCLQWCYDRVEGEKFADQGYLTQLERQFGNVHILKYPGINIAEDNIDNLVLEFNECKQPMANGLPVIYWHMHCLFEQPDGGYKAVLREDLLAKPVVNWAYNLYVQRLNLLSYKLQSLGLPVDRGNARYGNV